jgi:hypothetical protein
MFKKFLPKEKKFFELLLEVTKGVLEAATILNEMLVKFENLGEYSSKISFIEHRCDDITHKIKNELNETFITPIDREDIYALSHALDNIIDSIDVVANRVCLYKVKSNIEFGSQLSEILLEQSKILVEVIKHLEDHKNLFEKLVAIRKLETDGDVVFRRAISELFENEKDPIELIKKKEILEIFEKAVDRCQTASIVVESILIKNM